MVLTRKQYLWKFRLSGIESWMFSLVYYSMGTAAIQKTEYQPPEISTLCGSKLLCKWSCEKSPGRR